MHRAEDSPVLIAQSGDALGRRWPVDQEILTIGRAADCDVVVAERQVSRYHARLFRSEDGYWLEDLGSKNGTHINGNRIQAPTLVQDGDVIQIAFSITMAFVGSEATLPLSLDDAAGMGMGRLQMDPDAHRVRIGEDEVDPPLSPAQYRLLALLYKNANRVVSRNEIVQRVWPDSDEAGVSEQAIDALVRRLRDRLAEVDPDSNFVVTVRGYGFRLDTMA